MYLNSFTQRLNFSKKDGILPFSAYLFTNAQNFLLEVTQRSKYEFKALSICQEVAWHYNVFDARLTSSCIICLDHHGDKKTISKGLPSYKYTGSVFNNLMGIWLLCQRTVSVNYLLSHLNFHFSIFRLCAS